MIQPRATLVERFAARRIRKLVKADEGPAREPDDMVESTGVLIDQRLGTEQLLIPRSTPAQVTHSESDVGDRLNSGIVGLPCP